jgi:hypothetical protein
MRNLEQYYKGDNIYKFFREHWSQYEVVENSSLLEQLNDNQKI